MTIHLLIVSTSLHSALSGVESGARCTITEGPGQSQSNQRLSTYVLSNLTISAVRFVRGTKHQLLEGQGPRGVVENSVVQL